MPSGAVIVAAGRSLRMGANKLMLTLDGRPVILRVLDTISTVPEIDSIVLVTNADNLSEIEVLVNEAMYGETVELCLGGETRQDSVRLGIEALPDDIDIVLIHDAARPLVTHVLIQAGIVAGEQTGAAIAAIPVTDTIKLVESGDVIERTLDRRTLHAAQTPQVFRRDWLAAAYVKLDDQRLSIDFTDEASLLEWAGYDVHVFPGSTDNIKLTGPFDVTLAETILMQRERVSS